MRVEDDRSELHLVSRLVDGLVRLYEHRVALVHVLQRGGVEEFQAARAAGRQVVVAGADVADLKAYGNRRRYRSQISFRIERVLRGDEYQRRCAGLETSLRLKFKR